MIRRILLFAAALLAFPTIASAQDQEGTWALRINDANIWVFSLERDEEDNWDGSWLRAARFEGNGIVFVRFAGEELVETDDGMEREGVVQLRFRPTQRGGTGDVLHFTQTGDNEMTMEYLGTELEPYPLVRVVRGSGLGPFDENMIYDRDNAATVADYDPAEEPSEEDLVEVEIIEEDAPASGGEEGPIAGASEMPEPDETSESEPATEGAEEGAEPRMGADFLDGLAVEDAVGDVEAEVLPEPAATESEDVLDMSVEDTTETAINRACTDLDRRNLPDPEALDAFWGEDYEQLGNGLDIREYVMDDGQIARITVLEDRIFLNRCGPA